MALGTALDASVHTESTSFPSPKEPTLPNSKNTHTHSQSQWKQELGRLWAYKTHQMTVWKQDATLKNPCVSKENLANRSNNISINSPSWVEADFFFSFLRSISWYKHSKKAADTLRSNWEFHGWSMESVLLSCSCSVLKDLAGHKQKGLHWKRRWNHHCTHLPNSRFPSWVHSDEIFKKKKKRKKKEAHQHVALESHHLYFIISLDLMARECAATRCVVIQR